MKIIELQPDSPREYKQWFIDLNAEFNSIYGHESSPEMLESSLNNLLTSDAGARGWLALDDNGAPVAMSYFNLGTGMVCGGDYLWLNAIHVTSSERQKGHATVLLGKIVEWARERRCVLVICLRDQSNVASQALFDRHGFEYEDTIIMDKSLV